MRLLSAGLLRGEALQHFRRQFHLETHSFGFLARLDRLLVGEVPLKITAAWRRWTAFSLHEIDFLLLRIPGFDRFASVVVFKLTGVARPAAARLEFTGSGPPKTGPEPSSMRGSCPGRSFDRRSDR